MPDHYFRPTLRASHSGEMGKGGRYPAWSLDEADAWVRRAERTVDAEDRPVVAMGIKYLRGQLELGRGQPAAALSAFEAGEPLGGAHPLVRPLRAWLAIALVRLGELDRAERLIADVPESSRVRLNYMYRRPL